MYSLVLLLLLNAFVAFSAQGRWINSWTSMPQLTESTNLPNPPFNGSAAVFVNSTLRQTLHMSVGGTQIRVRFSNVFGVNNLDITAATIALPLDGAPGASAIDTKTLKSLTFSGNTSFSIPNGALVVSDPVDFPIQSLSTLAVTIYLQDGQNGFSVTSHPGSRTTTWMSFGNLVTASNITSVSATSVEHWYFISAVEVWSNSPSSSAFAIIGDSITDGRGSDDNKNNRWPDLVLARMQQNEGTSGISVSNQAAGGNRVLADGLGPNALGRIDRDVLAQSGVKYAMIFEGVNDIGVADPSEESQTLIGDLLISAYKQIVTRIHTFGIPVFAATITPFGSPPNTTIQPYSNPVREATRQRVNAYIRTPGSFDHFIDFDKVVADPNNPSQLNPAFNSGDFLHPNVSGYEAMANSFPLDIFEEFADGVSMY
ncbi:SGNH hydrolase-type esterase domain-containing protein [Lentinula edodes]|uniref:extracellular GDSL-like lipase/acylhydrolase n=1 Tax=Lentinula edodes TaxID=5353 RepID=UPI001E8E0B3F|nr:extracellular GDSL-like lipase/acylhydrolase [Lentinula edodes]KAH7881668.1 extracellular GDSL-like lipase/acylhydrolase [Lentinula edodes]KAJ3904637.1 SGNH hydrolase-type esterase domain-containing protein [Lentinula edodes]KAJ3921070.1 SGNH hydrolase-type esterase domain-containing protein [Lentinula edodes]